MGSRTFLGQKTEKVKEFGETKWKTYSEVGESARKFGAALRAYDLVAAKETTDLGKLTSSCSLAIFENTCAEWVSSCSVVLFCFVLLSLCVVVIALDDNLLLIIN